MTMPVTIVAAPILRISDIRDIPVIAGARALQWDTLTNQTKRLTKATVSFTTGLKMLSSSGKTVGLAYAHAQS